MIKNILFDMGNVVILFSPETIMTEKGITDPEDRAIVLKEIFRSQEWIDADAGIITSAQISDICLPRIPEHLRDRADRCVKDWWNPLHEIDGMKEFIIEQKAKGIGIFLLSNAPDSIYEYWGKTPAHVYFDGKAISFELGLSKPSPECFNATLDKFGIKAEETIFVDDVLDNVNGAIAVGMRGVQFKPGMDPHIIEEAMVQ